MSATKDVTSGIGALTIDEDDDNEDEGKKQPALTPEERALRAQHEREEKQRKYAEARERLFGASSSNSASGSKPPSPAPAGASRGSRGKGKARNGGEARTGDSRPGSSTGGKSRQLYDPSYTPKPDSIYVQKKDAQTSDSGRSTPVDELIIRQPKGPDGSGRGGHGFANRGRGRQMQLGE